MKSLRAMLMLLLLLLLAGSLFEETRLTMTNTGHAAAQILILLVYCRLVLWLVRLDEIWRLREIHGRGPERTGRYSSEHDGVWKMQDEVSGTWSVRN